MVAVVALLAMLMVWVLPSWLRGEVEERAAAVFERPVEVEGVSLNPFTLTMTIRGFIVTDHDGEELLAWQQLRLDGKLWPLLTGGLGIDAVELEGLRLRLAIDRDGELNVADMLARFESAKGEESRPLVLDQLEVRDARVMLNDLSRNRPFATTLGPISFSLADFHTKYDPQAPFEFSASTEAGERLQWRGALSLVPLRSNGAFEINGLNLPKYAAYYADPLPFEVESGVAEVSGNYEFAWTDEEQILRLSNGTSTLTNLTIAQDEQGINRQTVAQIQVTGVEADLLTRQVNAAGVALTDGTIELQRTAAGIHWLGRDRDDVGAAEEAPDSSGHPAATVEVETLLAERLRVRLEDALLPEPTTLGLNIERMQLDDFSLTNPAQSMGVVLEAAFPSGGSVAIEGLLTADPLVPDLAVELREFNLAGAAPYVRRHLGLEVVEGQVSLAGRIARDGVGWGWLGDIQVSSLRILDDLRGPFLSWDQATLSGSRVALDPMVVGVELMTFTGPRMWVDRSAEGAINVSRILSRLTDDEETVPAAVTFAERPRASTWVRLGEIRLAGGAMMWRDAVMPESVAVDLNGLSGAMQGWDSREASPGRVDLTGRVHDAAAFSVRGDLNPLGPWAAADLAIKLEPTPLDPVAGYIESFAGFALESGSLAFDSEFRLDDRAFESETRTVWDDFVLGARVDSSDATDLPIKLGVSLLKDAQGQMVIDLPASGELDDPEFRFGGLVRQVLGNLLTRAATSPFALLGQAVGRPEDEDIEHYSFEAGVAEIGRDTAARLARLAEALALRPGVSITVGGEFDPDVDRPALRPFVLENQLREASARSAFAEDGVWQPFAREAALVARYEALLGEPPFDPTGEIPPPPVVVEAVDEVNAEAVAAPERATLLTWLRRVFIGGDETTRAAPNGQVSEVSRGSFPVPEEIETELPALPMEEITRRTLAATEVPDTALRELAAARAQRVIDYLRDAGIDENRLREREPIAGASRVTLDLP